ncbi:MAG TPA: type II secretion system secretin GspD [Casimicrobiaceae bacterium]|nr:type II secretion system secretin GspD [Casimicrobiaceae bacterium]
MISHTHVRCRAHCPFLPARLARAAFLAIALALAGLAPPSRAADEPVTLNFVNADIDAVIKAIAEITGRNFVVDPKVKGTINIISSRPVPRNLVYPTLLSALRMQGFAAVEGDGGVVKIVPEADAKQQGGAVAAGPVGAGGDRLVTQVITLRYESAAQLVNVLRPLITPNNTIAAYPNGNALIITDYADNVKRLDRVIASLDQPPGGEPIVVPLRYASAIDLVPLLNRLTADTAVAAAGAPPDAQQRVTVIADPRSNAVLVRADNPGRLARMRQLIEQLDTPGRPGGNMFIVYLKNADAARVAQTLRAMLTGNAEGGGAPAAALSPVPAASMIGAPAAPAAAGAPPSAQAPFTASTQAAFAAGGATITADTANNALVIMAPEPIYNNLRAIIEKLDVRRAQVYVEALICEVSADKAAEFGIQWQALSGYNTTQARVIGGTNFTPRGSGNNIIDVAVNPGSVGQGLALGVMKGTVTIPGLGTITNLAFLARALETQVNANILSTPTLMTLDNEEARILVGQNIPLLTGSYATTGGTTTVQPFQTFERKDIGLMLRVKPQITEGGTVRLVVYQEVSRIDPTLSTSQSVVLNKRVLESSVVIDDSQIVVLGGLIDDQLTDGTDSVPLLGQIPIAGALFRYDARRRVKTNLLVFLKPTVLRTSADGRTITSERYDYLMGEQERNPLPERLFWQDRTQPTLPPEGMMPGTPGAAPLPTAPPPAPGGPGYWGPPEPPPPGAPPARP